MDPFAALADPVRRQLLDRLARGPARVVDLAADHAISRPAISRHLRVLGEAGLVAGERPGAGAALPPRALRPGARVGLARGSRTPPPLRRVRARRPRPRGPSHGPRPRLPPDSRHHRSPGDGMTSTPRIDTTHRSGHRPPRGPRRHGVRRLRAHVRRTDRRRLGGGDRVRPAGALDRQVDRRPRQRFGHVLHDGRVPGRARRDDPHRRVHGASRLVMRSARPDDKSEVWSWQLDLSEADGVTTLAFAQEVVNVELAESVGPGVGLLPRPDGRGRGRRRPGGHRLRRLLPRVRCLLPRRARLSVRGRPPRKVEEVGLGPVLQLDVVGLLLGRAEDLAHRGQQAGCGVGRPDDQHSTPVRGSRRTG